MVLLMPTLSASVAAQLSGGLCRPSMGASPCSRCDLGPTFLLEGGTWLSGHGAGEQMLLPVCAFRQASCLPGLLLSSVGLSPPKDHGSREHPPPPPPAMSAKAGSRSGGATLMGKPAISGLWKTLTDLRPACG